MIVPSTPRDESNSNTVVQVIQLNKNVTPEVLNETLENASQFWLISSGRRELREAHFEAIIDHWKKVCGRDVSCAFLRVIVRAESPTRTAMHLVW